MANYNAFTRSNYFKVTDEERIKELVASCACGEDKLRLFVRDESDGRKTFGFGCHDSISGLEVPSEDPDEYQEYDFDLFAKELQKILLDGDAIIITEIGYEKLRYLIGYSTLITKTEIRCVDIYDESLRVVKEMLGNPDFATVTEY
jgi:hypothetical protein